MAANRGLLRQRIAATVIVLGVFFSLNPHAHGAEKTTSSKNVEVVKSLYAAFERGDIEAAVALMDDNVEWNTPGPSTIPWAGTFKGKDGVRRFFSIAVDLLTVHEHRVNEFIAQKDKVVSIGYEDLELKAGGGGYRSNWAHVYTFHAGKIIRMEEFIDTAAQAAAFAH